MGTRVITQSAPDSLASSYIMVDVDTGDAHNAAVAARPSTQGENSSSTQPSARNTQQHPPTSDQPADTSSTDSAAIRDASNVNTAAHSNQQQYHPRNHPQARQYDQAGFPLNSAPQGLVQSSPNSPRLQPTHPSMKSLAESAATSPSRIKVRDLSHIQSFASEEYLARPRLHQRTGSNVSDTGRQYEISAMPVTDIIEMVAGLLTKITATNDRNHDHISRPIPLPEDQASMSPQTTSVLAFHGKNVPSITILSYLSRIHKYCPTTYEVFLSLLVYFDRMTEVVNRAFLIQEQQKATADSASPMTRDVPTPSATAPSPAQRGLATPPNDPSDRTTSTQMPPSPPAGTRLGDAANFFVVDSFNIHRLVIAGVTCSSKFFSDVFYTNSRYAKVGGLPLIELNHLELQFLILNDFRLSVPVEELEAYGTMLVEFYAREIVAQQQAADRAHYSQNSLASPTTPADSGVYMRDNRSANQATTA